VHLAPGIPCALCLSRDEVAAMTRARTAPREGEIFSAVVPGWSAGPDPEPRDSGPDASHRRGMTALILEGEDDANLAFPGCGAARHLRRGALLPGVHAVLGSRLYGAAQQRAAPRPAHESAKRGFTLPSWVPSTCDRGDPACPSSAGEDRRYCLPPRVRKPFRIHRRLPSAAARKA